MLNGRRNGYTEVKIRTAGPGERVVLLYSAIVKHLNLAMRAFELPRADGCEAIHANLALAGQIVVELRLALDHQQNAELAQTLENLYVYWEREISDANVNKDPTGLPQILQMVDSLRDTWQRAVNGVPA